MPFSREKDNFSWGRVHLSVGISEKSIATDELRLSVWLSLLPRLQTLLFLRAWVISRPDWLAAQLRGAGVNCPILLRRRLRPPIWSSSPL